MSHSSARFKNTMAVRSAGPSANKMSASLAAANLVPCFILSLFSAAEDGKMAPVVCDFVTAVKAPPHHHTVSGHRQGSFEHKNSVESGRPYARFWPWIILVITNWLQESQIEEVKDSLLWSQW